MPKGVPVEVKKKVGRGSHSTLYCTTVATPSKGGGTHESRGGEAGEYGDTGASGACIGGAALEGALAPQLPTTLPKPKIPHPSPHSWRPLGSSQE